MNIATVKELHEGYRSFMNYDGKLCIKFCNKEEGRSILAEWIVDKMTTISNMSFILFTKKENYNDNILIKIIKEKIESYNDEFNMDLGSGIWLQNGSAIEWSVLPLKTTKGIDCPMDTKKVVFIFESGIENEIFFSTEEEIINPLSQTFPCNVILIK
jgi:hypothetical protein